LGLQVHRISAHAQQSGTAQRQQHLTETDSQSHATWRMAWAAVRHSSSRRLRAPSAEAERRCIATNLGLVEPLHPISIEIKACVEVARGAGVGRHWPSHRPPCPKRPNNRPRRDMRRDVTFELPTTPRALSRPQTNASPPAGFTRGE